MGSSKNYSSNAPAAGPLESTVPGECAGLRLDRALAQMFPEFSRTRLARWVLDERVTVDGQTASPRQKVYGGESVTLLPVADPRQRADRPEAIPLHVVHEDAALLVIDKPPGLVVHPGAANWQGTLLNAVLAREPALAAIPRAGIVHRLDKDTSGLLVVAKTLPAQTALVRQLAARTVVREYLAVVHGKVPRDGKVHAPIGRHPRSRTRMAVVARGRDAVTHYAVVEKFSAATLLRCRLETGRTHQIRVHLAALGHSVVGDPTYGKRVATITLGRQALHAERLSLLHPTDGRKMSWQADPPADMHELIAALREAENTSNQSRVTSHQSRLP